jgi:hypothetical protein
MAFYATENSSNLNKEQILKDVNMFIQKFEYSGEGVAGIATNDITLTPVTSPAFTVDALISTTAKNVLVAADSSVVLEGSISDNDANSITFDATATTDISDGTAGAAADFTATNTYSFYALTPSSEYVYGDFFGWTNEVTINIEEEYAEYKNNVPRVLRNEGLLERVISVTGSHANLSNTDVVKALFNMTEYGSQTSQTELHTGFDPAARSFYQITLVGENINGQQMVYQFFKNKIRTEGGVPLGEEGFKVSSFTFMNHSDTLRPAAYDSFRYILADS